MFYDCLFGIDNGHFDYRGGGKWFIYSYLDNMIQTVKITHFKGATQMASRINEHETGFADILVSKGELYEEDYTRHYMILIVRKGEVLLSCKLYHNKVIGEGTMAFIPKAGKFYLRGLCDTHLLMFAFTTTIIRSDKEMLEYFCTHASKKDYTFNTLSVCTAMDDLLALISRQIHERKLRHSGICHVWNSYFFHIMSSYYKRDEITAFMRPIISAGADFESFIENNYLEAGGNVSRLIALSGLSVQTFKTRFKALYGMTAKQWLDEKLKGLFIHYAVDENMTPSQIAHELTVTPRQLNRFCRRIWGMTPGEVARKFREDAEDGVSD